MSKKRDFKGVASSIVSNKVTSLDDFFDDDKKPTQEPPALKEQSTAQKPPKPKAKPKKTAAKAKPAPSTVVQDESEKIRISLFLASSASFDLDELKMNMRRSAPRVDMSKISKSSIVEAAIDLVKTDFEQKGTQSAIFQKILH